MSELTDEADDLSGEVMALQEKYSGSVLDLIDELGLGQEQEEYMDPVLGLDDMKRLKEALESRIEEA